MSDLPVVTNPRFDLAAPVPPVDDLGAVHFVAIGGSGMSGVARMYLDSGVPVTGSDRADSAALRALDFVGGLLAKVVVDALVRTGVVDSFAVGRTASR